MACALREGTLKPFLEGGITPEWLGDQRDTSRGQIFPDADFAAWSTIVGYWDRHGKVPTVDVFRRSHPETTYELPSSDYTVDQLLEMFREDRRRLLAQVASMDFAELVGAGRIDDALALIEGQVRVINETYASKSIVVTWDDPGYDFEARINRKIERGVMTGIPGFDDQEGFFGFQKGSLICYLGRAKAGKTSFALLSALAAWREGLRVMFLSFEIAAGRTPDEPGIVDRLDSIGAGIHMLKYMQGRLEKDDQQELREFREGCTADTFKVIQPTGRYTVTDLESDIDRYRPDVVYIDGFYFMIDRETGKSGGNWEGHDNLAYDIKKTAMNHMIPIIITHQVREKQLTGKKGAGIDDGAMMGGTAITMFADLVIGVDANDGGETRTLSCTRSRLQYLDTVHGQWNWSNCTFSETANPFDQEVFGYKSGGTDDDDDIRPF